MNIPRLVVAGVSSGVGKTTITCAIINGLREQNLSVTPFKVGPDYIDPIYLELSAGRAAYNLDAWLMGTKNQLLESFITRAKDADVSVIEGVMGYYDGYGGDTDLASTYHVASITRSPVILVIDASKMSRSVAAVAAGFRTWKKNSRIAGVILNRLGSDRHKDFCTSALHDAEIPVVGTIYRDDSMHLEERHLGLRSTEDRNVLQARLKSLGKNESMSLNINKIHQIMLSARSLPSLAKMADAGQTRGTRGKVNKALPQIHRGLSKKPPRTLPKTKGDKPVIAVAFDSSFNFYYQDNLDALRREGADLVFFSPISDKKVPACDGLYIGGGFPEILAEELARNESMKRSVRRVAQDEAPVYAECGGLMYLSKNIKSLDGRTHKMVGLFDTGVVMTKKPVLQYTSGFIESYTPITGSKGRAFKGHEFHYSRMVDVPRDARFAMVLDYKDEDYDEYMSVNKGISEAEDGIMVYDTLAAYGHLYFDMSAFASMFVANCGSYKRR